MRPVTLILAVALALGLGFVRPAGAQHVELNIVTGGPSGTYIQIGRDIAGLAAGCGQELNVRESAGSLENVFAVRDRPVTQFGIVQSDVLEYIRTFAAEDMMLMRAADGVRLMFPLYDEEIHVLARRDVPDLAGLAGKRVAVGVENSGTFITAQLVLDLAQVEPAETNDTLAPDAALEALLAGDIDAMFYVVGAPAALFADPRIDPELFHLLPLGDANLQAVYTPTQIGAGVYPFQTGPVDLVAVRAMLVTFDYDAHKNAYHRASCTGVSDMAYLILSRFGELQASGHPKWKQVDLGALPGGWAVSDCALEGIDPDRAFACARPDGTHETESLQVVQPQENVLYRSRICAALGC